MPSVTLVPSGYEGLTNATIDSSYPIARGYTNADSTTYTRLNVTASSRAEIYFTFDTSDIPSGATITSVTANGKAKVSSTTRITNTVMQFYSGSTAKGSNTAFASTTATKRTLSPGSWTRSELNNLRLKVGGTASSSTSSKRIDFYGADITINYTVTTYNVTASGDGTLVPSGTTVVDEGDSYSLSISGLSAKPTVTDNNVDVTSQLVESTEVTKTFIPDSYTASSVTVSNISNAYTDADSDTYADLTYAGRTTGTLYLDIGGIDIPSGATIKSVSCKATLQFVPGSSTSGFTASCQMYSNNTAKGSSTSVATSSTAVPKTTFTLNVGSWTASEIANARFYLTATNNASSTQRHMYVYGVSFEVTYESSGVTYIYTINSVAGNHTIVVTASGGTSALWFKSGSTTWTVATAVYKKINGSWVKQTDLSNVFSSGVNYRKG